MPRYHLNFRKADQFVLDQNGEELPDLKAARKEALLSAKDILAEMIRSGERVADARIEISDDRNQVLEVVSVRDLF
jgi:hypothetical protein